MKLKSTSTRRLEINKKGLILNWFGDGVLGRPLKEDAFKVSLAGEVGFTK